MMLQRICTNLRRTWATFIHSHSHNLLSNIHLDFVLDFAFASHKTPIFGTSLTKLHSHFLSLQPSHILGLNSSNSNEWCEPNIRFENGGPLSYYAAVIGKFFRDKLSVLSTPEDGTGSLSRNFCKKLPVLAV